jgi:hypothetical protein
MGKIIIHNKDMRILITGDAEDFFASDLHTRAVTALITDADVGGWDKLDRDLPSDALSQFLAAVLEAVAQKYSFENEVPSYESVDVPQLGTIGLPESKPAHEILFEIIENLRQVGYLNRAIRGSGDLRAEEPEDLN